MKLSDKWEKRLKLFLWVVIIFIAGMTAETLRTKGLIEKTVNRNSNMVVFLGAQHNVLVITASFCRFGNNAERCARLMEGQAIIIRNFIINEFDLDSLFERGEKKDEVYTVSRVATVDSREGVQTTRCSGNSAVGS